MADKTARPTDNNQAMKTPPGGLISRPNQPAKEAKGSGYDPVGDAGQRDGQKGRPEAGVSPDDANKGKAFQARPDQGVTDATPKGR